MQKLVYLGLGWGAVALGVIGIALPVMPTTPFLILAAFLFGKSSPRLRGWLVNHAHLGPPILEWEKRGAIARPIKWLACSMMAAAFGFSLILKLPPMLLTIQLACMIPAALFIVTRPD